MRTKFQILFSVEVAHNYFSTGRWNELKFIPTPETEKLLRQFELTTRQIDNELLIITKTYTDGSLYQNVDLYTRFSFLLMPLSPGYLNFTNIAISPSSPAVFNFHNLNANEAAGKHFISQPIKNYDGAITYFPSDVVKAPNGSIYECIAKNNGGGTSVQPNNTVPSKEVWVLQGDNQFVTAADTKVTYQGVDHQLETACGIYNFNTSVKLKEHLVSVYGFNKDTLKYDKEVSSSKVSFDELYDMVQVDMRQFVSGKYRVKVNNDTRFLYLVTNAKYSAIPFFVDIFNLPAADPQAILDADQKPKHTRFTITFGARRVLWNYNTRTTVIDKIEDTSGDVVFQPNGAKQFISKKPVPFSEIPRKTLVAKSGNLTITSNLPNPQPDRLLDKKNEIYTTASFINY
nr:hypothetical protein [uncultured Mucilaginibacter sp.]